MSGDQARNGRRQAVSDDYTRMKDSRWRGQASYKIMHVEMVTERPLTFSDGERIVAVLDKEQLVPTLPMRLTVLVELPQTDAVG
jgi:hypothetical protein